MKFYTDEDDNRLSGLRISLADEHDDVDETDGVGSNLFAVPLELCEKFRNDGYVVCENVLSMESVKALNHRLELILRGTYDRGIPPDKIPRKLRSEIPTSTTANDSGSDIPDSSNCNKNMPSTDVNHETSSTKTKSKGADIDCNEALNRNTTRENDCKTKCKKNTKQLKKKTGNNKIGPLGFSGNLQNVKTLQVINVHKSDRLYRKLATNKHLGQIVSQLGGWDKKYGGARLAQDQIWAKPPNSPPLVFHRDTPYFMFEPLEVITVWIAFDTMDDELGPLQYIRKSHLWGDGRVGTSNQFFDNNNFMSLVQDAARREGLDPEELDVITMAGLQAGSLSIHHGKLWHGSDKNQSCNRPRRGLGLHFVPANVKFTSEAKHSRLWSKYVQDGDGQLVMDLSKVELSDDDFPIVS